MDVREIVWEIVDWIYLSQDRVRWGPLAKTVINLRVP